jgi:hypothetical protein
MSPAVLEDLVERLSVPRERPAPTPPLSFREIEYGYRADWSFGYSVVLHQLAIVLVVFSSHFALLRRVQAVPRQLDTALTVEKVFYLPTLGGGSEGAGKTGGGSGSEPELSQGVRARSRRGFAYPGPQPVVSDPPRAILGIQTILQPGLVNPPLLRRFIPLPNMTREAEVAVAQPPKPVLKVLAGEMALRRPAEKPIAAPKITLPVSEASQPPVLDASQPVVPQLLPAKPPVPGPAEISEVPVDRRAETGLLVLNAIPPPPEIPKSIPRVEARSLFAVTPGDATIIADPGAGSKGGGAQPSMAAGVGSPTDAATGDALADAASGGGSKGSSGSGTGKGGRYGSATGSGLNPSGTGSGTGRGTTAGSGTGSGGGTTLGSGKGAGSAPATGGFPGITVSGGRYGNSNAAGGLNPSLSPHRQTSYAMTITSTASSGGGLPDFGVFQNEKVYTVYLDMRTDDEDRTPSWVLQYAVLQPQAADAADRIRGTPTPPYAMLKQVPEFTPEVTAKCAHQLIIASAILKATGQLEQISMKQAPDPRVAGPLIEALKNWTFQPAQIDGNPVALKILLGIRLVSR